MRRSDQRMLERLPDDPDKKAITDLTAAIRESWTKRQECCRLRFDHQATRFHVPMISTRDIALPLND